MSDAGAARSPLAELGLRDLVVLAAWELGEHGRHVASRALLQVAASLEGDLWVVAGRKARLLRALIDAVPIEASVCAAIADRLL